MGANFDHRVYRTDWKEEAAAAWKRDLSNDQWENGHCFSGSLGMLTGDPVWLPGQEADAAAAIKCIEDKHEKWGPPLAVRFPGGFAIGGWCAS